VINNWIIKDRIKSGIISFEVGDEIVIFWRKGNGYPRTIIDNKIYVISRIESDNLFLNEKNIINSKHFPLRVHKTYMIPLYVLREIKLNSLFDETKLI
jgi:hypothetical protein